MSKTLQPPLSSGNFDRDAATRLSETALDAAWNDPSARVLRIRNGQIPLAPAVPGASDSEAPTTNAVPTPDAAPVLSSFPAAEKSTSLSLELLPVVAARNEQHVYLGRLAGVPVFAAAAREDDGYPEPAAGWSHPFLAARALDAEQLECMTVALALLNWHESSPFSARDGELTHAIHGGWARMDSHGAEHFPRTDTAVIVLVEHEDRVLLGSNVLWEAGRFSLLAGYVEAGENAEQCVHREVREEAGICVAEVRYMGSQPWPFPRSLMLGFRAKLAAGQDPNALAPDPAEISELRWFTREQLRNPGSDIRLPGELSIARWMLEQWLAEGENTAEEHRG